MSKTPENQTPETIVSEAVDTTPEVEKKPNVLVRGFRKIKANPKNTIMVLGGLALVGGAAAVGRATASSTDEEDPSPEAMESAEETLRDLNIPLSDED